MRRRCFDENHKQYKWYGGRGITVCPEWRDDFAAFLAHIGPRPSSKHSIDRYPDNNGNYEPGNVRWATSKDQNRNRRSTKLRPDDVAVIRDELGRGASPRLLAARFGVSRAHIARIKGGTSWV